MVTPIKAPVMAKKRILRPTLNGDEYLSTDRQSKRHVVLRERYACPAHLSCRKADLHYYAEILVNGRVHPSS